MVCIRDIGKKSFSQIYDEIYPEINSFREEKNVQHNKTNNLIRSVPS
jgi:hypothetical protein